MSFCKNTRDLVIMIHFFGYFANEKTTIRSSWDLSKVTEQAGVAVGMRIHVS